MRTGKIRLLQITTCIVLLFSVTSCFEPRSKESFLANFDRFVRDVERNKNEFKTKDWRWANKRFHKYSVEWQEKFSDELNLEEKVKITSLKARYMIARSTSEIGREVEAFIEEDLDRLGKDVKEYLDKNLEKDIREINEGAREIGDSAIKVMEGILRDLKKE